MATNEASDLRRVSIDPIALTWTLIDGKYVLYTHASDQCEGRVCDVHNRRGPKPFSSWPLYWGSLRDGRAASMWIQCPHGGFHPTTAQVYYWQQVEYLEGEDLLRRVDHDCDGCCAGAW